MNLVQDFFHTVYNVPELIRIVGQFGLPVIIFAETGLLVGFFLPGDSLLITAGLFAARGDLNLPLLIVTLIPAAILGNATGYQIGKRTGKALYSRPDSLLFRREHLQMTHEYYERHGGKTIIIAQFAPILRTFAPVGAGGALPAGRELQRRRCRGVDREHDPRRLPARERHPGDRQAHRCRRDGRHRDLAATGRHRMAEGPPGHGTWIG